MGFTLHTLISGREKELILFSAVRSNRSGRVGFLSDWRRLNVMLTRARRGLVVVGSRKTLRHDPLWQQWLEWAEAHHAIVDTRSWSECVKKAIQIASRDQADGRCWFRSSFPSTRQGCALAGWRRQTRTSRPNPTLPGDCCGRPSYRPLGGRGGGSKRSAEP